MASLNRVFLMGNLTRDPEVRYTPSGRPVGDLRMAVNRKFKTSSGEDRDETCYVSIVVWGRQAETCGEYLRKGSPLLVEGRLNYDEWEKDGQKFNRLRVVASRVQFLGTPRSGESRKARESEPPPDAAPEGPPPEKDLADEDNLPF
jgi:single-strand DNA-binding protein